MAELKRFSSQADHSWLRDLVPDPETAEHQPNKTSRQVHSGHYVLVRPSPLPQASLAIFSRAMAAELGLSEDTCHSESFTRFFAGNMDAIEGFQSWATPYALSIFGEEMYDNCPFKNGNGYGDGRALSVGEVVVNGKRWEMQLKGGGTTPFCRGADGRAVLRSSVREFLASEAMHSMGVETTRALSLVVSAEETVERPWYTRDTRRPPVDEELLMRVAAPQLAGAPPELKRMAMAQLTSQLRNPDMMQTEQCAITCRVAPSFTRVGHIELHGRRARKGGKQELKHLELIVKHVLFREFADIDDPDADLPHRILKMVRECARRLSTLVSDWLRVGYCQGNFNSDNCLVAGRTMDYGPFGFLEKYDPLWNMWVGGGEHFAFMNQPKAAEKNFGSLVRAVSPLLGSAATQEAREVVDGFESVCAEVCGDMWRRKLGLRSWDSDAEALLQQLQDMMAESRADYTILWRQLAELPAGGLTCESPSDNLIRPLLMAFYAEPSTSGQEKWVKWLRHWLRLLQEQGDSQGAAALMRRTSPKYVPREWMLVQAYEAAAAGNYIVMQTLHNLFSKPFDEQPEFEERYYRRAPASTDHLGGTAFMS